MATPHQVFISCVTDEFERGEGSFKGLRSDLAHWLNRAGAKVVVQEAFRQPGDATDTLRKVAGYLAGCTAVIHLIGALPGATAKPAPVADLLAHTPDLLDALPDLRAALGDLTDLTYTQWEAVLALHFGVPLFIYVTPAGAVAQRRHLERLASARRYPGGPPFETQAALYGQLLGDLKHLLPAFAPPQQRLATSKLLFRHAIDDFLGRDTELAWLDRAWADGTNVLAIIAWGGVGKTALLCCWLQTRFVDAGWRDANGQPNPPAYFDWSFYDQGTRAVAGDSNARTGSVGDFFEQALTFFGDPDPTRPNNKGARLAGLVRQQRSLLVLDGQEPLQHPPGSPQAGQLLEPDLRDLISTLAQQQPGLLIITSREAVKDLGAGHARNRQHDLEDLARAELAAACERFGCHALSLTVLGRFLCDAHGGDIRRIDQVDLHQADRATRADRQRTAWKVLAAYEAWLDPASAPPETGWAKRLWQRVTGRPADPATLERQRTLAVLRLTGLFDRAADPGCLAALRHPPIRGLTESLAALDPPGWRLLLKRLEQVRLIQTRPGADGDLGLDAHPLIREYFAEQLRQTRPAAWRTAHGRLVDHLCQTTPHRPDTLDGLQPLYQAVVHGCLAGRQQGACVKVYFERILRGMGSDGFYSSKKLGAISANLGAVAAFFDEPWARVSMNLTAPDRAWLLSEAAFYLRALGRLTEAVQPMRAALGMAVEQQYWQSAAIRASNLSELEVTLGDLTAAVADARRAVAHADQSGDAAERMVNRTTAADALHQFGERAEAGRLFAAAEQMQQEWQPEFPLLYSLPGFRYCDWLLAPAERAAWRALVSFARAGLAMGADGATGAGPGRPSGRASDPSAAGVGAADATLERRDLPPGWRVGASDTGAGAAGATGPGASANNAGPAGGTGCQPATGSADCQSARPDPARPSAATPATAALTTAPPGAAPDPADPDRSTPTDPLAACDEAERRAKWCFETREPNDSILTIALDHLTLARVRRLRALLTAAPGPTPAPTTAPAPAPAPTPTPAPTAPAAIDPGAIEQALTGLRNSGDMDELPKALLTAAWTHAVNGAPDRARAALDEASSIAERGPMPLFQADVLLHRARLWTARPWADDSGRVDKRSASTIGADAANAARPATPPVDAARPTPACDPDTARRALPTRPEPAPHASQDGGPVPSGSQAAPTAAGRAPCPWPDTPQPPTWPAPAR